MSAVQDPAPALETERFGGVRMALRDRTARGTLINGGFLVGTNALNLVKGLAVASFLSATEYGTWGLLLAAFMTIIALGSVGVDDKYVQQDDPDQKRAFEIAFTCQALLGAVFFVAVLGGMPLFSLLYGRPQMIVPGMVFALALPALVLQMPLWTHYRRMDFGRQRLLQAIDPVISIVTVLALAAAGLGLWALVCGELLGTWCAAIAIAGSSPYALRLRWDRIAAREYLRFSWPLFVGAISMVLMIQVPTVISARLLGVAAVGALTLATNISQFTTRVDDVVTQTLYPAVCAVKERTELLFESFWKANRLALLWAVPVGGAAALFAGDFVRYGVGERWHFAIPLIITFGINAAINQVGFNWTAFFRARGETKPIAVTNLFGLAAAMAFGVPLLVIDHLTGLGVGLCIATTLTVSVRLWFLRRLFGQLPILGHVARGIGPTLPAVAAVIALRLAHSGTDSALWAGIEALTYTVVAAAMTWVWQRELLRESLGYLRGRGKMVAA